MSNAAFHQQLTVLHTHRSATSSKNKRVPIVLQDLCRKCFIADARCMTCLGLWEPTFRS
jgi:hypothetical protein